MFTSCSSLWTQLDCTNVDKTCTYIQRSRSSPLEIELRKYYFAGYLDDAFSLIIPHLHRLKSLTLYAKDLPDLLGNFRCQLPLLEELVINFYHPKNPILDSALFDGDLSSLRKLNLDGVITHLPWNNMANLNVFNFKPYPPGPNVTQLLDFFESAPLLHTVVLEDSIPDSSNTPSQRIVSLPHLKTLTIDADPPHSILLNHLCIPTGASLILKFSLGNEKSPLLDRLPEPSANFRNLSHITMVNLLFDFKETFVWLSGPSGSLRVFADWEDQDIDSYTMDRRILHSLSPPILSTTQSLAISMFRDPNPAGNEEPPVFQTLSSTNSLRTLILTTCDDLPFIFALDPEENPSKLVLCPNLEEIVLYIGSQDQLHIKHLINMAKNRASEGAKLSSVTVVGIGGLSPSGKVFKLREHVTDVKCRVGFIPPTWDHIPGDCVPPTWDHAPGESGDESGDESGGESE